MLKINYFVKDAQIKQFLGKVGEKNKTRGKNMLQQHYNDFLITLFLNCKGFVSPLMPILA